MTGLPGGQILCHFRQKWQRISLVLRTQSVWIDFWKGKRIVSKIHHLQKFKLWNVSHLHSHLSKWEILLRRNFYLPGIFSTWSFIWTFVQEKILLSIKGPPVGQSLVYCQNLDQSSSNKLATPDQELLMDLRVSETILIVFEHLVLQFKFKTMTTIECHTWMAQKHAQGNIGYVCCVFF